MASSAKQRKLSGLHRTRMYTVQLRQMLIDEGIELHNDDGLYNGLLISDLVRWYRNKHPELNWKNGSPIMRAVSMLERHNGIHVASYVVGLINTGEFIKLYRMGPSSGIRFARMLDEYRKSQSDEDIARMLRDREWAYRALRQARYYRKQQAAIAEIKAKKLKGGGLSEDSGSAEQNIDPVENAGNNVD